MDRDLAKEYAEQLKANPLLDKLIYAMENVCYTNIKKTHISNRDIIDGSCLMLQAIHNFKALIDKAIEDKKPATEAKIKQIMRID